MLIAEIEKNSTEVIRIEKTNYNGRDLVSLRVYFMSKDGTWCPTRKGLTLTPATYRDLFCALDAYKDDLIPKTLRDELVGTATQT